MAISPGPIGVAGSGRDLSDCGTSGALTGVTHQHHRTDDGSKRAVSNMRRLSPLTYPFLHQIAEPPSMLTEPRPDAEALPAGAARARALRRWRGRDWGRVRRVAGLAAVLALTPALVSFAVTMLGPSDS